MDPMASAAKKTWIFAVSIMFLALLHETSTKTLGQRHSAPILHLKLDSLKVQNADMEEALKLLHEKDPFRILLGFEKIPQRQREKAQNMSLDLKDTTLGEVLSRICKADPR